MQQLTEDDMKRTFKFWMSTADADAGKKPVAVVEFEGPTPESVYNQAAAHCDKIGFNATFDDV